MEAALEVASSQDVPPEAQLQAFSLLIKIVSNVLEPPSRNVEEASKYRCLNSSSNALQQRVLRHGPAFENLLFALGFVKTVDPPPRVAQLQQQAEQQQQQTDLSKPHPEERAPLHQPGQQQQQTEQQQQEGGHPYYYYLPETVDLTGLVEALQLLRATTESLKLASVNNCSNEQQCAAGGDAAVAAGAVAGGADASAAGAARPGSAPSASLHPTDGVKVPLTTSRAIRGQAISTHAKNQAALRQLREEQRERFEQRAETTRSTRPTAAAVPAAVSRRDSRSRGGTDAPDTRLEKNWLPDAGTDAAAHAAEAVSAAPQGAAAAGSGRGKKKLQKGSSSLQAAGRFFRKLCKGKSVESLGKQRGGAAAT